MAVNTGIYDPSYQAGQTLAYKPYFKYLKEQEGIKEGKASSRKVGMASATLYGKYNKALMEREYLNKMTPGTAASPGVTAKSGKAAYKYVSPSDQSMGQKISTSLAPGDKSFGLTEAGKEAGMAAPKGKDIKGLFSKQSVGDQTRAMGLSKSMGSLMGAYQVGSGASTVFDPKASTTRKIAGAVNVGLGANALLATIGATQAWNPVGWGALAVGAGATLADMFG